MKMNHPGQLRVAIVGLGLLGASLGMEMRGGPYRRLGWTRRSNIRRWALDCDVIDETCDDLGELLSQADLTLLALPIPGIVEYLERYAGFWRPGAVVSDLGSVKSEVMTAARKFLTPRGVHFVGGHPMAGTEKSGPESAFPELYVNADVFLCPFSDSPEEAVVLLEEFWRRVGTRTSRIDAARHDDLVAHTSHVLHILASSLALSILDAPDRQTRSERFSGCATGFRDTSRIASSNPVMWREIIESNRSAVLKAMSDFETCYYSMKRMIETGDFDGFEREFARGKLLRDSWIEYKQTGLKDVGRIGD